MKNDYGCIIFIGSPGAGKGTQTNILGNDLNLPIISTGDLVRESIQKETTLGLEIKSYVHKGDLIPDIIIIELIRKYLNQINVKQGIILDGFPRTLKQSIDLDNILFQKDVIIKKVFNILIEEKVLLERIILRGKESGRVDDMDPEIIKYRLNIYNQKIAPVLDFYREKKVLVDIDGFKSIKEVNQELLRELQ